MTSVCFDQLLIVLLPALFRPHRCSSPCCVCLPSGPSCDVCEEGFYGDPPAGFCRPCNCNGHIDVSVAGSCDRRSGECLRCLNNTRGQNCEICLPGFYHGRVTDACTREKESNPTDTRAFPCLVLSVVFRVMQPATVTERALSRQSVTNLDAVAADRATRVSSANAPTAHPVSALLSRR